MLQWFVRNFGAGLKFNRVRFLMGRTPMCLDLALALPKGACRVSIVWSVSVYMGTGSAKVRQAQAQKNLVETMVEALKAV